MIHFTVKENKITANFKYDKKFNRDMEKFRGATFNGLSWEMEASEYNIERMNGLKAMYESRGVKLVSIEVK